MRSPVRWTMRGCGSALAASVFVCTLVAVPALASARQNQHAPIDVPAGDIKIHGHWVIEVRNPDGTVADRREFDNALTESGRVHLAQVLARTVTPSFWMIELGDPGTPPCFFFWSKGFPVSGCVTVEQSQTAFVRPGVVATLTKGLGGPGNGQLILSGHVTAEVAGQISRVATAQAACLNTVAPTACASIDGGIPFTSHDLRDAQGAAAPIPVIAGQIVQVTVTFSFCGSEGCQS